VVSLTPAIEAGLADHVWSIEEMCALLPKTVSTADSAGKTLILKALGERPAWHECKILSLWDFT